MRIGVRGFDGLLILGQLGPPVHVVVLVSRPFRKHRPEDLDIGHDPFAALIQPGRNTGVEVARGGVERAAQRARIGVEDVAELVRQRFPHVDDIDAGPRSELECEL
jgi:hypothetical protein